MSLSQLKKDYTSEGSLKADIKSLKVNEDNNVITIQGFANTVSKDRAGDVIVASAWTTSNALKNYMKNPIILFGHDHSRPIGKCINVIATEMGLEITCEIFADGDTQIFNLIKNGVLKTFSVGFRILDATWEDDTDTFMILDVELFEVSVVSVPCNQDSTFRVSKSMDGGDYLELRKQFIRQEEPRKEPTDALYKLAKALGCLTKD
jgi:HK97 family phage prohead protease